MRHRFSPEVQLLADNLLPIEVDSMFIISLSSSAIQQDFSTPQGSLLLEQLMSKLVEPKNLSPHLHNIAKVSLHHSSRDKVKIPSQRTLRSNCTTSMCCYHEALTTKLSRRRQYPRIISTCLLHTNYLVPHDHYKKCCIL